MTIRIAEANEYSKVSELYQVCNYGGGIQHNDLVVIAVENELIGAVRICTEHGIKVLRGMQINNAYRGNGIGTLMLKFLLENFDMRGCYCIPYKYLKAFYGQIGFEEILPAKAPGFIGKRLQKYLTSGSDVIVMKIN